MEYPKINTIWKRDEKTHKIIEGEYSCPEFGAIDRWTVTEKIDGTNIRVCYDPFHQTSDYILQFKGKTDNAQIPEPLMKHLHDTITLEKLQSIFPTENETPFDVILFGEGYGGKIQRGESHYRKDEAFILFDVWVDGWWLEYPNIADVASKLGIPFVPPLGICSTKEAVALVKNMHETDIPYREGIVATSAPMMMFRKDWTPIKWKLKVKDLK